MSASQMFKRIRIAAVFGLAAGTVFVLVEPEAVTATPLAEVLAPPEQAPVKPVARALNPTAMAPRGLASVLRGDDPPAARERHRGEQAPAAWAIPASAVDVAAAVAEHGKMVQVLPDGARLELTLDPALQQAAVAALKNYRVEYGVLVAVRPSTGEILALAEHAEGRPGLRHLALQGEGPAASVFKLVTATALVEQGGLTHASEICTHGGWRGLALKNLSDDARRDKECGTLARALGRSNNVAFARWADRLLEPQQVQASAERFLFNRKLPFLWGVGTSKAEIPTGSRLGFAKASAGFVGTTLSPLHAALIAAAIANKGVMMTPRLVNRALLEGQEVYRAQHAELARVMAPETAAELTQMMLETTTEEGSAGKYFLRRKRPRIPGLQIAGKTGSLSASGGAARHYSWFVAFAPAEAPDLALAALVVNGKQWTTKGAVIARDVLASRYGRQARIKAAQEARKAARQARKAPKK